MREALQSWVSFIFGDGMFSMAKDILSANPSEGDYGTIWSIVCGVYDNVCVPIGMGLVLIYFVVNMMDRSMQQQQMDVEHIVKMFMKLFFGLYIIEHGLDLMSSIYSLGFGFLNGITGAGSAGSLTVEEEVVHGAWAALTGEEWEGEWGILDSLTKALPLLFNTIIPFLGMWIIELVVCAVCFFRLIEFYLQTCAAPIALSDFFTDGTHGNGWKFLKNYIALALQMGIILLAVVIFNGILVGFLPECDFWALAASLGSTLSAGSGNISSALAAAGGPGEMQREWFLFVIQYLGLGASCVAVTLKSRSIAKEIVGVQ